MTHDDDDETIERWRRVEDAAKAKAMAVIESGELSADQLVAALRTMDQEIRTVPVTVRAANGLAAVAEVLVEVLEDAGVTFANADNAPAQLAVSMLAAWYEARRFYQDDADWLALVQCLPDAIEHARWNTTDAEPTAVESVRRYLDATP